MSTGGTFRGSIAPHIFAANKTSDNLTKIAQGLLCIPSLLGAFLNPAKILRGFEANQKEIAGIVTGIVQSTVASELDRLSGYINYFIKDKAELIKEISTAANRIFSLIGGFNNRVTNSIEFAKSQENCIYAASQLLSCITKKSKAGITNKASNAIRDNISPYVNKVGDELSSIDGAISGGIKRQADDVKYMQVSQSFIKNLQ